LMHELIVCPHMQICDGVFKFASQIWKHRRKFEDAHTIKFVTNLMIHQICHKFASLVGLVLFVQGGHLRSFGRLRGRRNPFLAGLDPGFLDSFIILGSIPDEF
jgi:hypothetical protein